MNLIKSFLKEEDGMGTVEIVVILAVLVSIALIFRKQIIGFVSKRLGDILGEGTDTSVTDTGK